jgi:HSP20 family protein
MYTTRFRNYAMPAFRASGLFGEAMLGEKCGHPTNNSSTMPAVNVKETSDKYTIDVSAPGMKKADFILKMEDQTLSVSSEKQSEKNVEGEKFTRREFQYHAFKRNFSIPESVNVTEISATYENGILSINLPKKTQDQKQASRKIEIS